MNLNWLNKGFICKELYAPFVLEKDDDYKTDIRKKYDLVLKQAIKAGADDESVSIIRTYKDRILEALNCFYTADLVKGNIIIRHLIRDIGNDPFAINTLVNSDAFPGTHDQELQFFRCRIGSPSSFYTAKDMLPVPAKMRAKSGNYRFSIPGNPSWYLSNSSYGCWIECDFPAEHDFNVSPVLLDGEQKVFNLAISIRDFHKLNEFEENRVHCWLKLYMLTIATSYKIIESDRTFKSEYVISQAVMMACKKLGYDGVAYYSKRVSDECFSRCAINLALFVKYRNDYSEIVKHVKIDDAYNYSMFKQLLPSAKCSEYALRSTSTETITNIGNYDRQFPYHETEFYEFDKFLFSTWRDKPNGKGKDELSFGNV